MYAKKANILARKWFNHFFNWIFWKKIFQIFLTFTGPCWSARPQMRLKTWRHLVTLKIISLRRMRQKKYKVRWRLKFLFCFFLFFNESKQKNINIMLNKAFVGFFKNVFTSFYTYISIHTRAVTLLFLVF